jgi:CheY-specific phosphatase CheX
MADVGNYQELARKYGFKPVPESVVRLTALIARQDAVLDEVAKVISQDKLLIARLLRAANPRAESEEDYVATTAEEALMRMGVGCALLLAMSTPLTLALAATFDTMLGLKLESRDTRKAARLAGEHLCCKIGFSGKAKGAVYLRLDPGSAQHIASIVLGIPPNESVTTQDVNDAVGELLNIATGNFKSNLCDAGLDCRLTPPSVKRTTDLDVETVPGGGVEHMAFQATKVLLFVDVTVNPWQE